MPERFTCACGCVYEVGVEVGGGDVRSIAYARLVEEPAVAWRRVEQPDGRLSEFLKPFAVPDNPALTNPFADAEKIAEVEIAGDHIYHVVKLEAGKHYRIDVQGGSGILVYPGSRDVRDTDVIMFANSGQVWFSLKEPGELTVRKLVAGTCNALVRVGRKV